MDVSFLPGREKHAVQASYMRRNTRCVCDTLSLFVVEPSNGCHPGTRSGNGPGEDVAARFQLLGQRVVQSAHRAGTGSCSEQFFCHFADRMRPGPADKHFCQSFCSFRLIPVIPLKHLCMELSLAVTGNAQIFNAPGSGDQIACIRALARAFALWRDFSPRRTRALLKLFAQDFFNEHPHRADCQGPHVIAKFLPIWHLLIVLLFFCRFSGRCETLPGYRQRFLLCDGKWHKDSLHLDSSLQSPLLKSSTSTHSSGWCLVQSNTIAGCQVPVSIEEVLPPASRSSAKADKEASSSGATTSCSPSACQKETGCP